MQALKIAFINILEDNQNDTKDIDMWVVWVFCPDIDKWR